MPGSLPASYAFAIPCTLCGEKNFFCPSYGLPTHAENSSVATIVALTGTFGLLTLLVHFNTWILHLTARLFTSDLCICPPFLYAYLLTLCVPPTHQKFYSIVGEHYELAVCRIPCWARAPGIYSHDRAVEISPVFCNIADVDSNFWFWALRVTSGNVLGSATFEPIPNFAIAGWVFSVFGDTNLCTPPWAL